jgi:hypothetical protein
MISLDMPRSIPRDHRVYGQIQGVRGRGRAYSQKHAMRVFKLTPKIQMSASNSRTTDKAAIRDLVKGGRRGVPATARRGVGRQPSAPRNKEGSFFRELRSVRAQTLKLREGSE